MRKFNAINFIPYLIALLVYLFPKITQAEAQPPSLGNFALPSAQQPGPLLSFGQNIIDKNQLQIFVDPNYLKEPNQHYLTVPFSALYGLSDQASILVTLPWAVDYVNKPYHSSGIGDINFQIEYAFYEKSTATYVDQFTLVNNLSLPTGSFNKKPSTGFGTASVFAGATFSRMSVDWLLFASPGVTWITKNQNIQLGTEYFYQCGLGRNIHSVPGQYIFFLLGELDGTYLEKNKIDGHSYPNSGGNIIYATPSLWFSTKRWFFQLGLSLPVSQHWNGNQSETSYFASATTGWTFN